MTDARKTAQRARALRHGCRRVGLCCDTDDDNVENPVTVLDELQIRIGIKPTIRDYGIDEQDFMDSLDEMTEQALDDRRTSAPPLSAY